jgi:hypothetical protein
MKVQLLSAKALLVSGLGAALLGAGGCSTPPGDGGGVGAISVSLITTPKDASCLALAVAPLGAGPPPATNFPIVAGQRSVITLTDLPLGNVVVTGSAFAQTCDAVDASTVPNWVGTPVGAFITAGIPSSVTMTMHHNDTQLDVGVDFAQDCQPQNQTCAIGLDCCGGACSLQSGSDFGACGAVDAICAAANLNVVTSQASGETKIFINNPDGTQGACTQDCSLAAGCGIGNLGTSVFCACNSSSGTLSTCSCPRPANYPGAANAPDCVAADGSGTPVHAVTLIGTACANQFDECSGSLDRGIAGCICLDGAWSCGTTNGWFH